MKGKVPKQQYFDIWPIHFHNYYPINDHIYNTGKNLVSLQLTPPLHYVVYQNSEANSSNPYKLLVLLNQNRRWGVNSINDGKLIL